MVEAYERELSDEAQRGWWSALPYAVVACLDTVAAGLGERIRTRNARISLGVARSGGPNEATMRLYRTNLVVVLSLMVGGATVALLSFSFVGLRSNDVPAPDPVVAPVLTLEDSIEAERESLQNRYEENQRLLGDPEIWMVLREPTSMSVSMSELAQRNGSPGQVSMMPTILNRDEIVSVMITRYPTSLGDSGIGRTVLVSVLVGVDGTVYDWRLTGSSGYPELDRAAQTVARSYRFSPAMIGDQLISVLLTLPISWGATRVREVSVPRRSRNGLSLRLVPGNPLS